MYRLSSCFWLCFLAYGALAQKTLHGTVTDPQGTPLAFVTVLRNGQAGQGVLTDIEGRFRLTEAEGLQSLEFRYVGFETRAIEAAVWQKNGFALKVVLQPADYALPEATVHAGENPADILIRKAIANRHRNNPERRRSFACTTYNKVLFDATPRRSDMERFFAKSDTTKKATREAVQDFNRLEQAMQEHHGFLMESVTRRSFRFPDQVQERVLLNRVSGFKNAGLVALANMVQPFTFYGDYLTILDKNYVNPISPGSPERYFFNIEDTLYAGPDTIWVISFHPRKGKVFEALEGVLHLHSNGWAIRNVRAHPAAKGNLDLKIEQAYQWRPPVGDTAGQWFPEQLNFEMEFKHYPAVFIGVRAVGRSYVTDVQFDAPLRQRQFDPEMPVLIEPRANEQPDSAWARWRALAPLNGKELRTYEWLDSLGQHKRFDLLSNLTDAIATGLWPLGRSPLSIDLKHMIRLNDLEGARLGLGLSTAQAKPLLLPRRLEAGVHAGFGFRDRAWKYGGYTLWRIARNTQTQLRVGWQRDLSEPGTLPELPPSNFVNRALYARRMDRSDDFSAALGSRLGRSIRVEGTFRKQRLQPGYPYRFGVDDNSLAAEFRFTETTLFFRYANGERVRTFLGGDIGSTQRWPVLELAFTRGWRGLWSGEYAYERWVLALYQSFFIRRLGHTTWRLEAGRVSPQTPLARLFTLNQTGGGWNLFVVPNTFQALPDTLFLADRFVNFYFSQEIGPVLYQTRHSAPFLTLLQNAAWGDLQHPELHRDLGFRTASKPLLESGLQLDNLLLANYFQIAYLGLGGAVFYRWGGLHATNWRDNVSFRLALKMQL